MSAATSSAAPPGSAWMKLACLSDTAAVPIRSPLAPAASISRPAESPGGLVNTDPAFWPPGWCSRRHRTMSDRAASPERRSPTESCRSALHHHLRSPQRRTPVAQVQCRRVHRDIFARRQIDDADPDERRRHVGTVTAGVHPHRAADRAGDADGPLEAGQTGRDGAPGEHRQAGRPAGADRRRRGPRSRRRPRPAAAPGRRPRRRRPGGWSPFPTTSTSSDGRGIPSGQRERDPCQLVGIGDLDEPAGRPADPVGAQRSDRPVVLEPPRQEGERRIELREPVRTEAHRPDSTSRAIARSAIVVTSPAPMVMHRSPGRSSSARVSTTSPRVGHQRSSWSGRAARTASTRSGPVDALARAPPRRRRSRSAPGGRRRRTRWRTPPTAPRCASTGAAGTPRPPATTRRCARRRAQRGPRWAGARSRRRTRCPPTLPRRSKRRDAPVKRARPCAAASQVDAQLPHDGEGTRGVERVVQARRGHAPPGPGRWRAPGRSASPRS